MCAYRHVSAVSRCLPQCVNVSLKDRCLGAKDFDFYSPNDRLAEESHPTSLSWIILIVPSITPGSGFDIYH